MVVGRRNARKHPRHLEIAERLGDGGRIGKPVRPQPQPFRFDDRRRAGAGAGDGPGALRDQGVHRTPPQLLKETQVLRSSLYHSTGTMPPSARLPTMPEPWN